MRSIVARRIVARAKIRLVNNTATTLHAATATSLQLQHKFLRAHASIFECSKHARRVLLR